MNASGSAGGGIVAVLSLGRVTPIGLCCRDLPARSVSLDTAQAATISIVKNTMQPYHLREAREDVDSSAPRLTVCRARRKVARMILAVSPDMSCRPFGITILPLSA